MNPISTFWSRGRRHLRVGVPTSVAVVATIGMLTLPAAAHPQPGALFVIYQPTPGAAAQFWTAACADGHGSHPAAAGGCAQVAAAGPDPFAPVPKDAFCLQIYGGPEQAWVKGWWRTQEVDAYFNRLNGCEVARWDRLKTLLEANR